MKDILTAIVKLRMNRGWTEHELAERSDLPQSTISSWYRKGLLPSIPSLEKICDALGITMSQLFAEENDLVELTPSQKELFALWDKLSPERREALLNLLRVI